MFETTDRTYTMQNYARNLTKLRFQAMFFDSNLLKLQSRFARGLSFVHLILIVLVTYWPKKGL